VLNISKILGVPTVSEVIKKINEIINEPEVYELTVTYEDKTTEVIKFYGQKGGQ